MNYKERDLDRISKDIVNSIDEEISKSGIFFRIFYRVKSPESINTKKKLKGFNYYQKGIKLIQDIIGIRVILYFSDDVQIILNRISTFKYELIDQTIDENTETSFAPTRINLIFKLPLDFEKEFHEVIQDDNIQATFELQIRTVLSEGWHEIDHDLRYKCKEDWGKHNDLSRSLNGILASLETSEFAILKLFEQLSHRFYKNGDFISIFRNKFRIRIIDYELSENLKSLIDAEFIKKVYKIEREKVLELIYQRNFYLPLNLENLVYFVNYEYIKKPEIIEITPEEIRDLFS